MDREETVRALLAAAGAVAGEEEQRAARVAARVAWVKERIADLKAAQERADAAWLRIVDALPDDLDEDELDALDIPEPPEQAELDAILAEIEAVRDHDRWPRHLYWGNV
jgi:hypothetical protein